MALEQQEIPLQQKVILGILCLVGLYMLYNKLYVPLGHKIKETHEAIEEKQKELLKAQREAKKLPKLEQELKDIEGDLKAAESKLPRTEELPKFIKTVTDTAARYNIEVESLRIGSISEKEYYRKHAYGFSLAADYHTFGYLFADIANLERVINISNLLMSPSGASDGSPGKETLNATFSLNAYTFKE